MSVMLVAAITGTLPQLRRLPVLASGSASPNSSNSNRLREVAEKSRTTAYMVDAVTQIDPAWLVGKLRIGVTAGASAPEVLVQMVIDRLRECGAKSVRTLDGVKEHVTFQLPRGLRNFQIAENSKQINA